ncbi:MAG: bifunctional phosphopantothenoylcysteine decarboxylase/phosphopantothenate--cysteine ligase CoaBC [Propionibacteriaceae bacterium]
MSPSSHPRVVLGVAGGIAAYKAGELLRRLTESGHDVTVAPTDAALEFVGAATWAALSGRPVHTTVWEEAHRVPHVALGREADLVLVAPATADLLARAASGRADDLLTNVLLTTSAPVVLAPAMHTEMWQHPATVANVATLRSRGVVVIDPDSGRLTGADSGPGRLPAPAEIFAVASKMLTRPEVARLAAAQDLAGLRVTVSAGGTREHLDPVRYLGNSSSGRMGWALARAARLRGAAVRLVAANVDLDPPPDVEVVRVGSTADLHAAMTAAATDSDIVVMAAAPADYTPADYARTKIKKDGDAGLRLELQQTTDVLADLVRNRIGLTPVLVGFAAETASDHDELLALGRAKLIRKGADLLALNAVGRDLTFGAEQSALAVLPHESELTIASKDVHAHRILDSADAQRRSG